MNVLRKGLLAVCASVLMVTAPPAEADMCHLSWDVPCCPIPGTDIGTATVTLTICNCSNFLSDYTWDFSDHPDLMFSPDMGAVTLEPGECIDIPIMVTCPADLITPGNGVQFSVVIDNTTTGETMKCTGSIRNSDMVKADPPTPVVTVDDFTATDVPIVVSNMNDKPILWDPTFQVMPQGGEIRVDPLKPVMIPARSTRTIVVKVNRLELARDHEPFVFYDIILYWDQNGDGAPEPGSSFMVRTTGPDSCAADLNGDGQINGGDLAILLAAWGPCP